MHIGLLTGGGDCPGLNAVIRAVALALIHECGARVTGIERGFMGLLTGHVRALGPDDVQNILAQGGTILGTHNRCNPFHDESAGGADRSDLALATVRKLGLDALVVAGGDGTMEIAHRFELKGMRIVGIPKTIDNDLYHTDRSFGFDSAVAVVAEALDRLSTTARSHGRIFITETMGRHAGWIALEGGIAGAADVILMPELPYSLDAVVSSCRSLLAGQGHAMICIAEGAHPQGGQATVLNPDAAGSEPQRLGGVGQVLEHRLQPLVAGEVRTTVLGHLQRGGTPTAFDRLLATELGYHAAQRVRRGEFGLMVTMQGGVCGSVALSEVAGRFRSVPLDHPLLRAAEALGVSLGR